MIVTFERDIKNQLIDLEDDIIKLLEKSFKNGEDVKFAFTKVLSSISQILYKTSLKHVEWHESNQSQITAKSANHNHQFTFFPGYVTNDSRRVFNIAFLKVDTKGKIYLADQNKVGYDKFNLDFWFRPEKRHDSNGERLNNVSVLSLAYHFLFLGSIDTNPYFSPEVGGTHQWASAVADEIALNDNLDTLTLLAFYNNKQVSRENQLKYKSWINIPFNLTSKDNIETIQDEIFEWCKSVVNTLDFQSNDKNVDKVKSKWPYNPYISNKELNKNKDWLIYRAYIVGFWMMLVLFPERVFTFDKSGFRKKTLRNTKVVKAWFEFTDYYKSKVGIKTGSDEMDWLNYRVSRIDILKKVFTNKENESLIIVNRYECWFTIPFQHRLDFSPDDIEPNSRKETGSAMILSNYPLDGEYFRFIIPWIKQMYDAMREYDTAFQIEKNAKERFNKAMKDANIEDYKRNSVNYAIGYQAKDE
ncbi:MAG: hypothetical protein RIC35_19050 [Marinoscillum sp.]